MTDTTSSLIDNAAFEEACKAENDYWREVDPSVSTVNTCRRVFLKTYLLNAKHPAPDRDVDIKAIYLEGCSAGRYPAEDDPEAYEELWKMSDASKLAERRSETRDTAMELSPVKSDSASTLRSAGEPMETSVGGHSPASEQPDDWGLLLDFAAVNYEIGFADGRGKPALKSDIAKREGLSHTLRARLKRESSPLTGDERHALITEIIASVDGLLAKDAVVSRDFLRYWQAYSGDIAKRILSAMLEKYELRRRG